MYAQLTMHNFSLFLACTVHAGYGRRVYTVGGTQSSSSKAKDVFASLLQQSNRAAAFSPSHVGALARIGDVSVVGSRIALSGCKRIRAGHRVPRISLCEPVKRRKAYEEAWLLLRLTLPDWPLLIGAFAALGIAAAGEAYMPALQANALNTALGLDGSNPVSGARSALTRLGVVGLVTAVFTGFRGYLFWICGARLVARLRTKLFHTLLSQPQAFHDEQGPGELSTRLAADCVLLGDAVSLNVNIVLRQLMQTILSISIVLGMNARLAGLVLLGVAFRTVFLAFYSKWYRAVAKALQDALAASSGVAEQCLSLIKVVRAHGNEGNEVKRYSKQVDRLVELEAQQAKLYAGSRMFNGGLDVAMLTCVIGLGGTLAAAGLIPREMLTPFVLYVTFISVASSDVVDNWSDIQEALGSASKVFDYLSPQKFDNATNNRGTSGTLSQALKLNETAQEATRKADDYLSPAGSVLQHGALVFDRVNFSYPSRPSLVIDDFSLSVNPGESLAIVGGSGSGKSTIFALALRFYQPSNGEVLLDSIPLDEFDEATLRSSVAWVQQEPPLFPNATIRENIVYGLSDVTQEQVDMAAKEANAYEFIQTLPNKFDTRIGGAGTSLSGGQKQRVALARALVRKPAILLLDEATSALDPESERLVQAAIRRASEQRTVLFTTHKVAQAQYADRIIVMSHGKIVEDGTHKELLQRNGPYAGLMRAGSGVSEEQAAVVVDRVAEKLAL